eukprot:PRCOL_00004038-RA
MRRGGCRLVGSVKLPANADGSSVVVGAAAAVGHANAAANGGDASVRALAHDDALSTQIAFSAGARQQGGLAMSVFFPRGDAAAGGVAGSGGVLEIVKDLADDPLTPAEAEAVRGVVAAVEELRGQVRLRQQEQGHRERRQRQRQPQQLLDADDGRSGLGSRGTAAPRADGGAGVADEAFQRLEAMGARVFLPKARPQNDTGRGGEGRRARGSGAGGGLSGDWGELAGYSSQKRAIEDTVLLAITRPDVYAQIARGTRKGATGAADEQSASLTAVPRAVLFEGPPGTGKTSAARVMANAAGVCLVYIPLEAALSKYYGEAERRLAQMFSLVEAAQRAGGRGCVLFIDEIDALATQRGGEMHEATRRILSVLLRRLDGLEAPGNAEGGEAERGRGGGEPRTLVIAATNRKMDLDSALRSRFDASVHFGLPDISERAQIFEVYASHLSEEDRHALAVASDGFAGRDIRNACEMAERRWAAAMVRGETDGGELPTVAEYQRSVAYRQSSR